jgi:site-specific recombinase XerD
LVFGTRHGGPLASANLCGTELRAACERAGLERIDWYTLRHTHGTLLPAQGTSLKNALAQPGHLLMPTTLEDYPHVSATAHGYAVDLLEKQLFPSVPKFEVDEKIAQEQTQLVQ